MEPAPSGRPPPTGRLPWGENYGGRTTNRERAGNLSRTPGDKRNSLMKPIDRIHDVEASATTEVITKAM